MESKVHLGHRGDEFDFGAFDPLTVMSAYITGGRMSFEKFCRPREFELQPQQKALPLLISPTSSKRGMLLLHKIGSGKTCTSIRIAERFKGIRKIYYIVPAALQDNVRDELRGDCASGYITAAERRELADASTSPARRAEIIELTNRRIDKVYTIMSYNKFVQGEASGVDLSNAVLIIDEVQNLLSDTGSWYAATLDMISNAPASLRVVLMSATPMFDSPAELALCINLLRPKVPLPTGRAFMEHFVHDGRLVNASELLDTTRGLVSYYAGAPDYVFPQVTVKYIQCQMSRTQRAAYDVVWAKHVAREGTSLLALSNNFMIGPRVVSNIAFPNGKISDAGADSFKPPASTSRLATYSCKLAKLMDKLSRAKGTVFIYSNFKEYGGLRTVCMALDAAGWTHFMGVAGPRQYAVWSGDTPRDQRSEMRRVFSDRGNTGGKMLKIILGSPSIKEGVTFKNCRNVFVLDLHWNWSRMLQVIGRASRHCSHADLPPEKRTVRVSIFLATSPGITTVDEHIKQIMEDKRALVDQFETLLIKGAIKH